MNYHKWENAISVWKVVIDQGYPMVKWSCDSD